MEDRPQEDRYLPSEIAHPRLLCRHRRIMVVTGKLVFRVEIETKFDWFDPLVLVPVGLDSGIVVYDILVACVTFAPVDVCVAI